MFDTLRRMVKELPKDLEKISEVYEGIKTRFYGMRAVAKDNDWEEALGMDEQEEELEELEEELERLEDDIIKSKEGVREIPVQRIHTTIYLAGETTPGADTRTRILCTRYSLKFVIPTRSEETPDWVDNVILGVIERVKEYCNANWHDLFDTEYFAHLSFQNTETHVTGIGGDGFGDGDCDSINKERKAPSPLPDLADAEDLMAEQGYKKDGDNFIAI